MLDIVADYAEEHFFQVSQSKSNVVVFDGGEHDAGHRPQGAAMWHMHGMYNDGDKQAPDHLAGVDEYQGVIAVFTALAAACGHASALVGHGDWCTSVHGDRLRTWAACMVSEGLAPPGVCCLYNAYNLLCFARRIAQHTLLSAWGV